MVTLIASTLPDSGSVASVLCTVCPSFIVTASSVLNCRITGSRNCPAAESPTSTLPGWDQYQLPHSQSRLHQARRRYQQFGSIPKLFEAQIFNIFNNSSRLESSTANRASRAASAVSGTTPSSNA